MDEYNGFFRIATTIGQYGIQMWNAQTTYTSSIANYIRGLLKSKISHLEKKSTLHGFMETSILVTFIKVDPFFTIDVSDPYNPKSLAS